MIEVEIRGRLTKAQAEKLRRFLRKQGKHITFIKRVQILLTGYPGYHANPNEREVDIRLRETNGKCGIMVKKKAHSHNAGREEHFFKMPDDDLATAKQLVKSFGCSKGLWMYREKDNYRYRGVEWGIVHAGKNIYFYEAERRTRSLKSVEGVRKELVLEAEALGFSVFSPKQYHDFVIMLGKTVNKWITW